MASPQTGATLDDRVLDVASFLASIPHLDSMRYSYAQVIHRLEKCLEHARLVRLRTGQVPQVGDSLDVLSRVVADHPAFTAMTADATAMRTELLELIGRIARGR
jgi:hypothetical protein